jgi:tripartite-type tricarboxylate transporter receptor subunit TctC
VSISKNRKSRAETPPIVSNSRRPRRRQVKAVMLHHHPFRVNAASLPRRQFLQLAAGTAVLPSVSRIARAQTYPARPVRLVVPTAAGSATDIVGRLVGQWLSERLGQQFVIENRSGAGQNIGTEAVVRAPPDGYTLLLVGPPAAINATLYDKLNFNFVRDIAPVASMVRVPYVMEVNPLVPAKTVPELIAYAKANPGKLGTAKFESCNFNGLRCGV